MNEPTCGTCQNWIAAAANPLDLSERTGQCRLLPPQLALLPTPRGVQQVVSYPVLPAEFPACGQHKARVALAVVNGASE